jgi:hypothetical protein
MNKILQPDQQKIWKKALLAGEQMGQKKPMPMHKGMMKRMQKGGMMHCPDCPMMHR